MEKTIGQITMYYGQGWPQMYGTKVRMSIVHKNGLAPDSDPDDDSNYIDNDEDLAKAGGLGELDWVDVYPWIESEGRFSWVAHDAHAVDLEYMQQKLGMKRPAPLKIQKILGTTCRYLDTTNAALYGQEVRIMAVTLQGKHRYYARAKLTDLMDVAIAKRGGLGPKDTATVAILSGPQVGQRIGVPVAALSILQKD